MDAKMLNTYYDFQLADGSTAKLTLNFYYLYQLRNKNKSLYNRYNKILNEQSKKDYVYDEIDNMEILYTAYCCANMDNENALSEEDFFLLCGSDRKAVGTAIKALLAPKN